MIGILICYDNDRYCGIGQLNCLCDYIDNKSFGDEIQAFIDSYTDEQTQLIEYGTYAVYDAEKIREKIDRIDSCRIIVFADDDEQPNERALDFIGYDVCADDYYTSPIGMGYLTLPLENAEYYYDDLPFFTELHPSIRRDYANQLNDYRLLDSKETADEITEYCNWLVQEYDDIFSGAQEFKTVKIFKLHS